MRQQRVTCPFEPARRLIEPILCGLFLLMASVPAQASEEPAFPPEVQAKLNAALTQTMTENAIPGCVVGIWVPGEGTWVQTRGVSDLETREPMRPDAHFRIGSITKTFTITALLQLAEERKLGLDDPIANYLPFVPDGARITLRMLANMTSGLYPYTFDEAWQREVFTNRERVWTPRELVETGFRHPSQFAPGQGWEYCNSNTVLLGMVIEKVTGQELAAVFQQRIFQPLGLRSTLWPTTSALPAPFPHGYTEQTLDGKQADVTFQNPSWAWAVGNLISDLGDLRRYAKAVATGEGLISPSMQQQRLTWVTLPPNTATFKYGLGIGFNSGWLGHTGSLPGYNVTMYYLPERDATLVVMVNSDIPAKGVVPALAVFEALARIVTPNNVPRQP